MVSIFHIITSTDVGGAENMLLGLLRATDRECFAPQVVSLIPPGPVADQIAGYGVPVHSVRMSRKLPNPMVVRKLARLLRREGADIVQTWMYHADLVGGMAAALARVPVVWNIRHSVLDPRLDSRRTIQVANLLARLSSRMPRAIVTNSSAAKDAHVARGYAADKITIIPNGFDTTALRPDAAARSAVREELGVGEDTPLVGMVGRYAPHKHHANFIAAAGCVRDEMTNVNFVLCGENVTVENAELMQQIDSYEMRDSFHLLGRRSDVARVNAVLDVATSSSRSEAFPMVVGEAMACGVPCVVTDVGDSRMIVGDCGWVVPPEDPDALAAGWLSCLRLGPDERREIGLRGRRRVEEKFALPAVSERYHRMYLEILGRKTAVA